MRTGTLNYTKMVNIYIYITNISPIKSIIVVAKIGL